MTSFSKESTPLEPMPERVKSIQPGGGCVMQLELAWGKLRRWWLKTFRPGYVARMKSLRQGEENRCPHEVLDPRDVKFFRNQPGNYWWPEESDPFRWRDRLCFARAGFAELLIFTTLFFGMALISGLALANCSLSLPVQILCWIGIAGGLFLGGEVLWFFRDPPRKIPQGAGDVISPADGTVSEIVEIDHDEFIGGPAILIGIFLSVFNVHVNRSPRAARVIGLGYHPGKFLNALRPESARENERMTIRLEELEAPHRRIVVSQITGAIARRIVCWLKPGDVLTRGEKVGMIKFGSRTEIILPREEGLKIIAQVGQKIKGGSTILAQYDSRRDS